MRGSQTTAGLTMRWAQVVDEHGRTRLEARWTDSPRADAPVHASHAA